MKILKNILLTLIIILIGYNISNAGFKAKVNKIWSNSYTAPIPYCDPNGNEPCGLAEGINQVKGQVGNMESNRSFSVYIQDIIQYVLGFITLIAIIYIIYAGFNILIGAGDEEKAKKTKSIIIYVIVGMFVIWLAYPIVLFIIDILNTGNTPIQ